MNAQEIRSPGPSKTTYRIEYVEGDFAYCKSIAHFFYGQSWDWPDDGEPPSPWPLYSLLADGIRAEPGVRLAVCAEPNFACELGWNLWVEEVSDDSENSGDDNERGRGDQQPGGG
jgi:hypothetical protein